MLYILIVFLAIAHNAMAGELTAEISKIPLEISFAQGNGGSIIATDVDNNGSYDLIVTERGYIGAYATNGKLLWSRRLDIRLSEHAEIHGLPGLHGPGVQAGDINGDGKIEVLFLDQESRVRVLRGDTGQDLWSIKLEPPSGAKQWEHLVIANFRGKGDRDLLLQATNKMGYRMGRYIGAYSLESLQAGKRVPLWQRDDFGACAHSGARVADLDGDGRDEVLGATILSPEGNILVKVDIQGHLDSLTVADVRSDFPGLEVVMLEEGILNRIFLVGHGGVIWNTAHKKRLEPQNSVVGHFTNERTNMQIWCRSRQNTYQTPFVFNGYGHLFAEYIMNDVIPPDWSTTGIEEISPIHWTGKKHHLACAKERHKADDVTIFDPISGRFMLRIHEKASRLYVADILGDWREEIIVANENQLHIYSNPQINPRPGQPPLWSQPHYRRSKMTWNYYNP
ncbi:MAG: hypothetical protein OEM02_03890 [Desulfobulbaceae bacterium]|nr:hypothetical protein [Desulfobulbaceae bacterium]